MKQNKQKFRSIIKDVHLHDETQIGIPEMKSKVNSLVEEKQAG
jgi:hypothetical protein